MELVITEKRHLRLPLLVACGQGLSFNQIAGFFDQQDYKKEPIIVYNFLHGDNHQGKVAYKTTTFGWVLPGLSLIQLDYKIIRSTASREGIKWYLSLFTWNYSSRESSIHCSASWQFGWLDIFMRPDLTDWSAVAENVVTLPMEIWKALQARASAHRWFVFLQFQKSSSLP